MTVTRRIKVKSKNVQHDIFLGKGILKFIIIILAFAGVNRGIDLTHSKLKRVLFYVYAFLWSTCIFSGAVNFVILSTRSSIRALIFVISYLAISISSLVNSFANLKIAYTKHNKLNARLNSISYGKYNNIVIVGFIVVLTLTEFQSLASSFFKHTGGSFIRKIPYVCNWYVFFVTHFEYVWRYVFFNAIRKNLEIIYKKLKKVRKVTDNSDCLKIYNENSKCHRYNMKSGRGSGMQNALQDLKLNYIEIVEAQKYLFNILNPLFIINVVCSLARAFFDIHRSLVKLKQTSLASFDVFSEIGLDLMFKLKTITLVLILCYECNRILFIDKKVKINLTEILIESVYAEEKKCIMEFLRYMEMNEKKFLIARIVQLDMSLPWLCFVNLVQYCVLVMQFLKVFS